MKIYKKLASQTFVYGLGTIVPRILNYSILTYFYTHWFTVEQYGILTELYAYVTFLMILLTYGTETGYFRFAKEEKGNTLFTSLLASLFSTSMVFVIIVVLMLDRISILLEYENNKEYILLMALIIAIDAFSTIPFAKIRKEERSIRFAYLKIINVVVTIIAVFFFYKFLPYINEHYNLKVFIETRSDIKYVLVANLIASSVILLLVIPEIVREKFEFDWTLLKRVLAYSFPLLIAGLAGTINETLDRVLLKHLVSDSEALYILGIYGANYRLGVLLFIFIQMFRYAVEPFYFNYYGEKDEKEVFARIMRLFIAVTVVIAMLIMFYLKYIKFFIDEKFHEGLSIVPIILMAYIFYGIFFNQSIWYKLQKKTGYAILLTLIGAGITIVANVFFVKRFSYTASAYGHLFAYFTMMVVSYIFGRKYYKIDYRIKLITEYILIAIVIFALKYIISFNVNWLDDILSIVLIGSYCLYILKREDLLSLKVMDLWKLK